jgi:cytochrome c6
MKTIVIYAMLLGLALGQSACGGSTKGQSQHVAGGNNNDNIGTSNARSGDKVTGDAAEGKIVFEKYCVLCHGDNGKMQLNGSKDITISKLPFDLRLVLIKDGKNLMTPFNGILTDKEIEDVAAYSMTLKP